MNNKRIARSALCVIAIAAVAIVSAHGHAGILDICGNSGCAVTVADNPVAATQNTITTTGPVTSDTVISLGTLAGQVLTWVMAVFGSAVGALLTAWLYRLFTKAGVDITDAMRDRLHQMVVNGLNIGAATATADMAGKGQVAIKNQAIATAVRYVQEHGAQELKALGVDPMSNIAVDAIKARIQTAITDANSPTPKILDPVVTAAIPSSKEMTK